MRHLCITRFKLGLKHVLSRPVSTLSITPWLYDIIEPTIEDGVTFQQSLEILSKALEFFQIRFPKNEREYALECRFWTAFAHELTVKHANSIGMYRVSRSCMRTVNNSYVPTFGALADLLVEAGLDTADHTRRFFTAMITLIHLAYAEYLPLVHLEDLEFTHIDHQDIHYDVVHSLVVDSNVLRFVGESEFIYHNVKTKLSIVLPLDEVFQPIHYIAISAPRPSGNLPIVDMAYYGADSAHIEYLLTKMDWEINAI